VWGVRRLSTPKNGGKTRRLTTLANHNLDLKEAGQESSWKLAVWSKSLFGKKKVQGMDDHKRCEV